MPEHQRLRRQFRRLPDAYGDGGCSWSHLDRQRAARPPARPPEMGLRRLACSDASFACAPGGTETCDSACCRNRRPEPVNGPRRLASAMPADCTAAHGSDTERRANSRRSTWAELIQIVFLCHRRARVPALRRTAQADRDDLRRRRRAKDPGPPRTAKRASNPRALTRRRRTGLRRVRRTPANICARAPRAREATHCHASQSLPLERCRTTLRGTPRTPRPAKTAASRPPSPSGVLP